ncbi:tyrosine-type recombinase/integrase [Mesorhizobium sp.]|uniref:tyrosine-type recombinase/integrase n=1 Tax=Mesorhizobium sp. TaxID=1871066 RepID=UPI000FE59D0B|nr:tyrosine-type recombinase/integrase [Mesorhizobium sp.]RWO26667.1 MAG: integrase [Mesorhizobium sp.]
MFEELFLMRRTADKHQSAPLAEERIRYLRHLKRTGASQGTLLVRVNDLLNVVRLLDLVPGDKVSIDRIEEAAAIWSLPGGRRCKRTASPEARQRFIHCATQWLAFLGWLHEPRQARHLYDNVVVDYRAWLRSIRGLAGSTIERHRRSADHFLSWLTKTGVPLVEASMTDIDGYFASEEVRATCSRMTIHSNAQSLRVFFRFGEDHDLCARGLAAGILPSRFTPDETVPKGLKRQDVIRLLATTEGNGRADKRDRAILMLLIAYGLRAGEVVRLQLDDFDWENELLRVHRPKTGRTQFYPLSRSVGQAVIRYIRDVRPSGFGRSVFFTMVAPIRPIHPGTLGSIIEHRLKRIGISSGHRGTHALRHAAAQHLLDQGIAMKGVGDFLGHRNATTTAIYAKVNLSALREVGDFNLGELA